MIAVFPKQCPKCKEPIRLRRLPANMAQPLFPGSGPSRLKRYSIIVRCRACKKRFPADAFPPPGHG